MLYNLRLCQLAHAAGEGSAFEEECRKLVLESTFATLTNVNFDDDAFGDYLEQAASLVSKMESRLQEGQQAPRAPPGLPAKLPAERRARLLAAAPAGLLARSARVGNEDLFGVVEMATYGLKGTAAYLYHAEHLGAGDAAYSEADRTKVYRELFRLGAYIADAGSNPAAQSEEGLNHALAACLAMGSLNLEVMRMLDAAHCHVLGTPSPVQVSTVPPCDRPAVLVSGHDLGVLLSLLEQSRGRGVDVYTHGEMLPAHGYPNLRAFEHLRGHFGTHWGNQLHEFRHFPGTILMTSNCLRPPTKKYVQRLWTSGPVGFHGVQKISNGDYGPLIDGALALPNFTPAANESALRGSSQRPTLQTGFGHQAVLGVADKVVDAVKSGQLKHIFVIGGCDGTETTRSYFTDLARDTPPDSIILTMGCGKFRLNSEDHGVLAGIPRLLDLGQCNDAYGAIIVATKLSEALKCSVHDLPLHFAVSWFEQKAVAVLLTLLHLKLKNIRIGPAVPAFLTPTVISILNKEFGLRGTDTADVEEDLNEMLSGR